MTNKELPLAFAAALIELKGEMNRTKAFEILGAEPGPGIDIIFLPDLPVAHFYTIKIMTAAGAGFCRLFHPDGRIASGRPLTQMKKALADLGLSFHTEWSGVVEIVP